MKKALKRLLALSLCLLLCLSCLALPAGAASAESEGRADRLYSLHLFRGVGTKADGSPDYDLGSMPQRLHGLIMLLRLLGAEEAALQTTAPNPFGDVAAGSYGVPYVSYAYAEGITTGTGEGTFTPAGELSAKMFIAFLMRALGYGDVYAYGDMGLPKQIGLLSDKLPDSFAGEAISRGDMVDLAYAALTCPVKDLGLNLAEKLRNDGVFTQAEGEAAAVLGSGAGWSYEKETVPVQTPPQNPAPQNDTTLVFEQTSLGYGSAYVMTVNTQNPRVHVKSAMVDNTLGHVADFSTIAANSGGALAIVNGNFFEAYNPDFQYPIGHVMVNGEFLLGISGLSSLGIKKDGSLQIGRPALFTRLRAQDGREWSAYEVNDPAGFGVDASTLFTPAYGRDVTWLRDGWALTVRTGAVTAFEQVASGAAVPIPADGYVVYMGPEFVTTAWFKQPLIGDQLSMEYYLFRPDAEGFTLEDTVSIVSGGPRLITGGVAEIIYDQGFSDESRFGANAASTRTAVGITREGLLLIVSAESATLQQLADMMLERGCTDAINLDGGYSRSLYYNGQVLASGRPLTVTLQIFVDQ